MKRNFIKNNSGAIGGAAAVLIVIVLMGGLMVVGSQTKWFGTQTVAPGATFTIPQPSQPGITTVQSDGQAKTIANLRTVVKDCEAGTYLTNAGTGRAIQVFAADVDPSDANANPIINVSAGSTDTSGALYTNTDYKVLFHDTKAISQSDLYYDRSYFGTTSVSAGKLTAPPSTTATVDVTLSFDKDLCVRQNGTFVDILDELVGNSTTTSRINGQSFNLTGTNNRNVCATANPTDVEVAVGTDCYVGQGETLYYNQSVGDSSFYLDLELGVSGGNRVAAKPVICFKDIDGDMNKTQFTALSVSRISGDAWDLPSDMLNHWKNDQCTRWSVDDFVDGGKSGVYRFTFTVSEVNWVAGEEFSIILDDLGGWYQQDLRNSRAIAQSTVTIDAETI